jgi:hypothetical protein
MTCPSEAFAHGLEDDQIWTLDSMADCNPLINSIAVAVGVEKETVIQCLRPSLYGLFGKPVAVTIP